MYADDYLLSLIYFLPELNNLDSMTIELLRTKLVYREVNNRHHAGHTQQQLQPGDRYSCGEVYSRFLSGPATLPSLEKASKDLLLAGSLY